MKEKCPGLPNWEALKDPKCAEAFSTPDTAPNGRYLGGPVTWEGFDDERVQALGLPFQVIHAGTDAAMFAELALGHRAQGADHAVDLFAALGAREVRGRVGRIPRIHAGVLHGSDVGHQPDMAYDCGKPHGEIWKYAWAEMKNKWPVAYKVAKNFTIDAKELGLLGGQVDLDGKTIEEVAQAWVDANEADGRAGWNQAAAA